MSAEDNKGLGRRLIKELWGRDNLEFAYEVVAPDFVVSIAGFPGPVYGPEGVRQLVTMFRGALPDLRETMEDQVAGDDKVTNLRFSGTHQDEMLGIAQTGQQLPVEEFIIQYYCSKGKIVRVRSVLDALGMLQQIGAIPSLGHQN